MGCDNCKALYKVSCQDIDHSLDPEAKSIMFLPPNPEISIVPPVIYRRISINSCRVRLGEEGFAHYSQTGLAEEVLAQPGFPHPQPEYFTYLTRRQAV